MTGKIDPIPPNYNGAIPYITVDGARDAIEFYKTAFDAREVYRLDGPGGKVGHAELLIGERPLMISDEYPDMDVHGPKALGGSPIALHLYVEDVDAVIERAVAAGGVTIRPVEDQFYGDRAGKLRDPFGHMWWVATRKEELTLEEIRKRAKKLFGET
jgi:PhnB protein